MTDINRVEIGNAIIAGIASGDDALEQMSEIITHIERAGFAIVPRALTDSMRVAAVNTLPPQKIGDPPLYQALWGRMLAAAEQK